MKALKIVVELVVTVSDEVADLAAREPDTFCVDFDLAKPRLMQIRSARPVEVPGQFVSYKTIQPSSK